MQKENYHNAAFPIYTACLCVDERFASKRKSAFIMHRMISRKVILSTVNVLSSRLLGNHYSMHLFRYIYRCRGLCAHSTLVLELILIYVQYLKRNNGDAKNDKNLFIMHLSEALFDSDAIAAYK